MRPLCRFYEPYCSSTKRSAESTKWCMEIFVERLQERTHQLGLSQAEVARLSGLNERRFNHYARGRRQPDLATLVRIAKTLQTTPNWLLGVEVNETSDVRERLASKIGATCLAMDIQRLGIAATLIDALAMHEDKPETRNPTAKPRVRRTKP